MLSLAGKSALVTGASRGIGQAVSLLFGRLGARVAVNYARAGDAARDTVARIAAAGGQAVAVQGDMSLHADAGRIVDATVDAFGALDILVVNHGIWKEAPVHRMTPQEWDETIRVNLTGAYAACHHAARHMIPRRAGTIVTIASTSGQRGEANYAHYSASKGGLIAFTRSLALELAPHGIRVNGVAPGWVLTDMTREALSGPDAAEAVRPIPAGRAARPEEIAGPVAFLASPLASYVWGEILCVNGGAVMVG